MAMVTFPQEGCTYTGPTSHILHILLSELIENSLECPGEPHGHLRHAVQLSLLQHYCHSKHCMSKVQMHDSHGHAGVYLRARVIR